MRTSAPTEEAPIEIVAYDPSWPDRFSEEQALLAEALKPWLVAPIEHVGSTSVPGLIAKPIIDIAAPVASLKESHRAIEAVCPLGYQYFPYKPEEMHWFCKPSPAMRTHQLHIVPRDSAAWAERLAFRDALRSNPKLAAQYAALKLQLATKYRNDREAYTLFSAHLGRDIAPQIRSVIFGGVERPRDVQKLEYLYLEYVEGRKERAHSCPVST